MTLSDRLLARLRTVPDWPKPGIQFRDITPLFLDPPLWRDVIAEFAARYRPQRIDAIAGLEARGFLLGSVLAYELDVAFVPIRKQGKLPHRTLAQDYALEYGEATLEIHADACRPGERIVLADDLVATGGTLEAGRILVERLGARVVEAAAVIDLPALGGSERLRAAGLSVHTLVAYDGH